MAGDILLQEAAPAAGDRDGHGTPSARDRAAAPANADGAPESDLEREREGELSHRGSRPATARRTPQTDEDAPGRQNRRAGPGAGDGAPERERASQAEPDEHEPGALTAASRGADGAEDDEENAEDDEAPEAADRDREDELSDMEDEFPTPQRVDRRPMWMRRAEFVLDGCWLDRDLPLFADGCWTVRDIPQSCGALSRVRVGTEAARCCSQDNHEYMRGTAEVRHLGAIISRLLQARPGWVGLAWSLSALAELLKFIMVIIVFATLAQRVHCNDVCLDVRSRCALYVLTSLAQTAPTEAGACSGSTCMWVQSTLQGGCNPSRNARILPDRQGVRVIERHGWWCA
jgi:hypothetical protein